MTTYHTDANAQIDAFAAVKKRYIKAPHPAWTAVQVAGLLGQRGITEIKITAKRPSTVQGKK
jgi:enamine deaminase RidA (YjgF/YER057c/UK114 family)